MTAEQSGESMGFGRCLYSGIREILRVIHSLWLLICRTRCPMATFCQEVQEFIRVSEAIQGLLASGKRLTPDEKEVLEQCAIELLSKLGSAS